MFVGTPVSNYEFWPSNILGKRAMQLVRDHLYRRQERKKSRTSKQICYGKTEYTKSIHMYLFPKTKI